MTADLHLRCFGCRTTLPALRNERGCILGRRGETGHRISQVYSENRKRREVQEVN